MKIIYDYFDYRDFLSDFYKEKKKQHTFVSYQYIANKIQADASYVAKLLHKKIHISPRYTQKICALLKLNPRESEYFELLVAYNKTRKDQEQKMYLEKMATFRSKPFTKVSEECHEILHDWYTIPLLEIFNSIGADQSASDLAALMLPPITPEEVEKSIQLLDRLGFIEKTASGRYCTSYPNLSINEEDSSTVLVEQFKKSMEALAHESMKNIPEEDRLIITETVTLSDGLHEHIKKRLQELTVTLSNLAIDDQVPDRVYQINLHMFPVTLEFKSIPPAENKAADDTTKHYLD